jgi:hypothetical protein
MGVHPGPSVVRAKGFLTGDVNQRRDHNPNGSVSDPWVARVHESILTNNETPPVSQESLEVKASDFNPSSGETGSRDLTTSTSCHSELDVSPVERRTPTRCCQDRGRTSLIHREHQRFHRWPYPARSVVLPTPPAPIGRRTRRPGDPIRFAVH